MPQECFDWEHNRIYSNNLNVFSKTRQDYCRTTPFVKRTREIVCPQFQTAVGTGVVMGGANRNLLAHNAIYDNWRQGVLLLTVPAVIRGDNDPDHQTDTSNGNHFIENVMGRAPDGTKLPNGKDFSVGRWRLRQLLAGEHARVRQGHDTVQPAGLPGQVALAPAEPGDHGRQLPCTAWDPSRNPQPMAVTGSRPRRSHERAAYAHLAGGRCRGIRARADGLRRAGHRATGALVWEGTPDVFRSSDLPDDRVVVGHVRNRSSHMLHLRAAALRVRDAHGATLLAAGAFTASYAHGLFGAFQQPSELPIAELARLGRVIELPPGASAPLFAAWRLRAGSHEPVTIETGAGALPVPGRARSTAG